MGHAQPRQLGTLRAARCLFTLTGGEELSQLLKDTLVGCVEVDEVVLLSDEPPRRVFKCNPTQGELLLQHQGLAAVGADNDLQQGMGEGVRTARGP